MSRRSLMGALAAGVGTLAAPRASSGSRPKVVVIGGGSGGATAARYIAHDSAAEIEVTLIEPTRQYYTCYFSNLYIAGFWDYDDLAHGYGRLAARNGINVVHDWAVAVDREARQVRLAGGSALPYDRLVISPGIDFVEDSVPGWSVAAQNAMPHAYRAGSQTRLLRDQLMEMREGGVFCLVAPPHPYRCPPGPYERICMVAHLLKQRNPKAKILLVDPKPGFPKQALFEEAWQRHYGGMIERIGPESGSSTISVDPDTMTVDIDGHSETVDVCNVIPAQKAGHIAEVAGLTDDSGWAPVHPGDMTSRRDTAIHVLGDAADQGDMPKSGFAANSQAKVAANAICHALLGQRAFPARYMNTCWSLLGPEDGVKVGAVYEPKDGRIRTVDSFISTRDEDAQTRQATFRESVDWYHAITTDMFS
ncbi:FCSD flavin-binding domain-containing protein [Fodinicurvata halophila]|uniref:FCSD flavin-binding domain-containing protein n=1 Tax=Fodinicurvata halophila TaxID=1419723 RepID=A0ABV8UPU9_9PROT